MSVIGNRNSARRAALAVGALLFGGLSALPACHVLSLHDQSTVAQGKYYASGDPRYDEFFVGLFLLQVEMDQAPHVPELERLNLGHALGLTPQAAAEAVAQHLHDEAQKLSRSGLRMRLDQNPASDKPDTASAAVRTSERPKEKATATLLSQVETSATGLLRSIGEMKQAEEALDGLELAAGGLDASVDKDLRSAPGNKLDEVKKNLADAHELIALMKTRASAVHAESERLLSAIAQAVDTDDGSLGPTPTEAAAAEAASEAAKSAEAAKKPGAKAAPVKAKPKLAGAAPATPARPKPSSADSAEPANPPAKPTKAAAAPRDFEP